MNANPERGEFDVVVGDETLTLKMTMSAGRRAQAMSKKTVGELFIAASRMDYDAILFITWALLQANYAARFKNLQSAEVVLDAMGKGGVSPFFDFEEQNAEFEASVRARREAEAKETGQDPQEAQSGTGESSSEALSALA